MIGASFVAVAILFGFLTALIIVPLCGRGGPRVGTSWFDIPRPVRRVKSLKAVARSTQKPDHGPTSRQSRRALSRSQLRRRPRGAPTDFLGMGNGEKPSG